MSGQMGNQKYLVDPGISVYKIIRKKLTSDDRYTDVQSVKLTDTSSDKTV